ncbi:hypothetical protein L208DRAFT_1383122 [Tricholoma matsutake]|nr:hypothetical protein L208DRAFT_1383122 [Tricholoma matsutake 945]
MTMHLNLNTLCLILQPWLKMSTNSQRKHSRNDIWRLDIGKSKLNNGWCISIPKIATLRLAWRGPPTLIPFSFNLGSRLPTISGPVRTRRWLNLVSKQQEKTYQRKILQGLLRAEQKEWEKKTIEHHKIALEQWKLKLHSPLSLDPIDRQHCIQGLVKFAQPLLNQLRIYMGMHMTLLASGPEPGDGGHLNLSLWHHAG